MKKPRSIVLTVLVFMVLLIVTIPVAGADGRSERVTGRMSDSDDVAGLIFSINAWIDGNGSVGGRGYFYHPSNNVEYLLDVSNFCTGYVPNDIGDPDDGFVRPYAGHRYAIAAGTLIGLNGTEVDEAGFAISIVDSSGILPDAIWWALDTEIGELDLDFPCNNLKEDNDAFSFPTEVLKGNFHIRTN